MEASFEDRVSDRLESESELESSGLGKLSACLIRIAPGDAFQPFVPVDFLVVDFGVPK